MFNREIFSKRFKLLRTTHQLSMLGISELLELKSTGSISNFETQKMIPSADVLINIADLFGVSLDWLTGRIDKPYNNEILLKVEEELLLKVEEVLTQENMGYFCTSALVLINSSHYRDPAIRAEFSLAVRANLVFLINWFKHMSNALYVGANIKSFDDFKNIVNAKLAQQSGRRSRIKIHPRLKACVDNLAILQDILMSKKDIVNPLFDITETFGLKHEVSDIMINGDEFLYNLKTEIQKSGISEEERQQVLNVAQNMKDMIRKMEEKLSEIPCDKD